MRSHAFVMLHTYVLPVVITFLALAAVPAVAQSTAFTYQGNLQNAGQPTNGLHDFRFSLFDAATGGAQVGTTQCVDNILVSDGLFAATVDFGAQFASTTPRFLQIEVRADTGLTCSNLAGFVMLGARQPITSAPVASHAKVASTAFSLSAPDGSPANAVFVDNAGKVGIGTVAPTHNVHIATVGPTIALQDTAPASQQAGYVSYRDNANIERAWVGYGSAGDPDFSVVNARSGGDIVLSTLGGGRVGIGTASPAATLDVRGEIRLGAQGNFFAIKSLQSERLLPGSVSALGGFGGSGGFTVSHPVGSGVYTVNFATPFTLSTPIVVATPEDPARIVRISVRNANQATFVVTDLSGAQVEGAFTFIVVGR